MSTRLSAGVHWDLFVAGLKEPFFVDMQLVRKGAYYHGSPQVPFILPCDGKSIVSRIGAKSGYVSLEGQWLLGQGGSVPVRVSPGFLGDILKLSVETAKEEKLQGL